MITTIHFSIYGKMLFKNNISEIKLKQIGLNQCIVFRIINLNYYTYKIIINFNYKYEN